ncbi:MAG: RagB/SusD family nutrient uptake outer membrane protein, partial [Chitinophagaceae bacterium]|nr:RagB/SusD family nutrient uptake outer membrane protein [Chitinophagaceae bacterium]
MKQYIFIISLIACSFGCQKKLDVKPDKSLVVPSTLKDLQALLDAASVNSSCVMIGEAGADNYYLQDTRWAALAVQYRNIYVWEKDLYPGITNIFDWYIPYEEVFRANVVLEALERYNASMAHTDEYKNIKGTALFIRAHAFYQLAQLFCKPYSSTAATDLGIPLKLNADVTEPVYSASVQETYNRILTDLQTAKGLLPYIASYITRPSVNAVYALSARVYLTMGSYDKALEYSNASLDKNDILLDFNTLSPGAANPIPVYNNEIVWDSKFTGTGPLGQSTAPVDTLLYAAYAADDLRKVVFFKTETNGLITFKGNYSGSTIRWGGIANDEIYLVRAECKARNGDKDGAMNDLNFLLQKRWKAGTFAPLTASTADEALGLILNERRKELLFRG